MKNCSEIRENISLYIDDELPADERGMFEEHVEACADCRREYNEIMRIVGFCRDMQEVELPENFRDELHRKLLDAAGENRAKSRIVQRSRYVKIFSSVAAGFILIFLVSGIYRSGFFSHTNTGGGAGKVTMTAEQARAEKPADKSTANSEAAEGNSGVDLQFGEAMDSAGAQLSGSALPEVDRSAPPENRAAGEQKMSGAKAVETASGRTATLTVLADDPAAQVEGIKAIAVQNGGEEQAEQSLAAKATESFTVMEKAVPENKTVLTFSIPNEQYDSFAQSLNSSYGQANVEPGALVSEDLTATLNGLITKSNDLDTDIKKLEDADTAANGDKIKGLRTEKDTVQNEIETIRLNSDFTIVTVIILKK